jgi:4-amino-4-deoxy-L-arabinose transferase-like glycosyltransferase
VSSAGGRPRAADPLRDAHESELDEAGGTTAPAAASRALARIVDRLSGVPLVAAIGLAVAVRLLAGLAIPAADTATYEFGWLAHNLVDGRGYSYYDDSPEGRLSPEEVASPGDPLPSAYMPPVYTAVTTAADWSSGSDAGTVWSVRLANLAAAAAGVALMRAVARHLVGRRAAALAALGYAVYPPLVYMSTQVSAANLYVPLELGVLLLLLRAGPSRAWARWLAAGVALGTVALLRAEAVALVPLAVVWLLWTARRRGVGHPARLAAVFLAAAILLPGAWMVRNSVALGTPVLTVTTTGGKNLWIGNHDGATGSQKDFTIPAAIEDEIRALPAGDDFEVRADAVYRRAAVESITGDPAGTIVRDAKKVALLLGADVYDERALNPLYLGPYLALVVAGGVGFVRWWRRRPPGDTEGWLVVGYVAFSVAVPAVFFALARYRLPLEVILVVFAASWLAGWRSTGTAGPAGTASDAATAAAVGPEPEAAGSGAAGRHGYARPHGPA